MDQRTATTNEDAPDPGLGFAELGLRTEILETLNDLGYEEPTPIQQEAIPVMLAGRDMIGQAATGTGESQMQMLKRLELPPEAFAELKRQSEAANLIFLSTPFDQESGARKLNRHDLRIRPRADLRIKINPYG